MLAVNQAEPLFALGRWDDALAIAAAALDHFLAPGPMNRALLHVITGSVRLARGDLDAASRSVMTARGALRSVRYEDQHQLPLARLEILHALAADGPAAGLAATSQTLDRFELGGSSPRYGWPVVVAGAFAVLAGARLAGPSHDERLVTRLWVGGSAAHGGGEAGDVRPGTAGFRADVRGGRRGRRAADRRLPRGGHADLVRPLAGRLACWRGGWPCWRVGCWRGRDAVGGRWRVARGLG